MPLSDEVLKQYHAEAVKALAELDQIDKEGKLTADIVCAWMAKWKNTATYKHLGLAMTARAQQKGKK